MEEPKHEFFKKMESCTRLAVLCSFVSFCALDRLLVPSFGPVSVSSPCAGSSFGPVTVRPRSCESHAGCLRDVCGMCADCARDVRGMCGMCGICRMCAGCVRDVRTIFLCVAVRGCARPLPRAHRGRRPRPHSQLWLPVSAKNHSSGSASLHHHLRPSKMYWDHAPPSSQKTSVALGFAQ